MNQLLFAANALICQAGKKQSAASYTDKSLRIEKEAKANVKLVLTLQ